MLAGVHPGLDRVGRFLAWIVLQVLALALFVIPLGLTALASFFVALGVREVTGAGMYAFVPGFLATFGLAGIYVAPHVGSQITAAMQALTPPEP